MVSNFLNWKLKCVFQIKKNSSILNKNKLMKQKLFNEVLILAAKTNSKIVDHVKIN